MYIYIYTAHKLYSNKQSPNQPKKTNIAAQHITVIVFGLAPHHQGHSTLHRLLLLSQRTWEIPGVWVARWRLSPRENELIPSMGLVYLIYMDAVGNTSPENQVLEDAFPIEIVS